MNKKYTLLEWITKARLVHGDKYDYSKAVYVGNKSKVIIICPEHGEFLQTPSHHTNRGHGCPKCGKLSMALKQSISTESFISKAKLVHNDIYDYSLVEYVNSKTKVDIICPVHGKFKQAPNNHLSGGGCEKCGEARTGLSKRSNTHEFVCKAKKLHIAPYQYNKVNYINAITNVIVTCAKHGDFSVTPNSHLSGQGCPDCASSGFNKNKPAYLYYLKITTEDNQILYKIGITNRTVEQRFNLTDLQKIEIVKQKLYQTGQEAYMKEQALLKKYKCYKYQGPNVIDSGNTELFTEDILRKELNENYYFG